MIREEEERRKNCKGAGERRGIAEGRGGDWGEEE